MEVPTSLIHELQIATRKLAGLSSYNPDDPPDLPSVEQTISELDPSCPPHLRCQQCQGPLLRGLQSIVCVYCGAQQRREVPPDPIHFRSTFGYRWLLDSLNLKGSEAVAARDSIKGKNRSKDQLILSDLFDYELKWPSESIKDEINNPDKAPRRSKISLNLGGVDLDNFISEKKKEASESAMKEQEMFGREMGSTESNAFPYQENINLFENRQSSDVGRSTEAAADDPFSGGEAEFQSARLRDLPVETKAIDHFPASFPNDLSSAGEVAFPDTEIKFEFNRNDKKPKEDLVPPTSKNDSWIQDDQWHTGSRTKTEQLERNRKVTNDIESTDNSKTISSMKDELIYDNLWPSGSTKAPKNEKNNEDEDAFDAWQDFTSAGNAPDPLSSSWNHTITTSVPTNEEASEKNLVNFGDNLQDMDFGSFTQPDLFPGASRLHNDLADVNSVQDLTSDRVVDVKTGGDSKSTENADGNSEAAMGSESADNTVEMLMSQMPDLSFMLESNLSIPKKEDNFDSIS